jgi:prophage regulatory protein
MESTRRFIRLPEVQRLVPLSRSRLYELIAERRFPAPYKLSERASGWDLAEIEAWTAQRAVAPQKAA